MLSPPPIVASSTLPGENRCTAILWLRVTPEGTVVPVRPSAYRSAHHRVALTIEYPTYEEETEIYDSCVGYTPQGQYHFNQRRLNEWRIARCLIAWDIDRVFPNRIAPVQRVDNSCTTDTVEAWRKLPPLVRKAILAAIDMALGHA